MGVERLMWNQLTQDSNGWTHSDKGGRRVSCYALSPLGDTIDTSPAAGGGEAAVMRLGGRKQERRHGGKSGRNLHTASTVDGGSSENGYQSPNFMRKESKGQGLVRTCWSSCNSLTCLPNTKPMWRQHRDWAGNLESGFSGLESVSAASHLPKPEPHGFLCERREQRLPQGCHMMKVEGSHRRGPQQCPCKFLVNKYHLRYAVISENSKQKQ